MSNYWIPRSLGELEQAIVGCSIEESAYLDVKRYPVRDDKGRQGIAKDLAAFSVHGGVIIFGIAEHKDPRSRPVDGQIFELMPGELKGWREWVSQIAAMAVQPAVRVSTFELEREAGVGYLVVVVPQSARAPHMVEGRYYGRTDTTNRQLSDIEARELWLRNLDRRTDALALLRAEVAREPAPESIRTTARLFVVAQPVSADDRLLLDVVPNGDLRSWAGGLEETVTFQKDCGYAPSFGSASMVSRRARGVARSRRVDPDRVVRTEDASSVDSSDLVDLEIHEDGSLHLYYGRASDLLRSTGRSYILATAICGEVSRIVQFARDISEHASFKGAWTLGVAIVGLKGLGAHKDRLNVYADMLWPYSEDTYEQTYEADHIELMESGSPVLEQLLGRFCRALLPMDRPTNSLDLFPVA